MVAKLNEAGASFNVKDHHYVRLERLHVNTQPQKGQVALEGVVTMREYYGLYIKYYLKTGSQLLKVIEKNDGVNIYEEGESLQVVIDAADVMAYPGGEEV